VGLGCGDVGGYAGGNRFRGHGHLFRDLQIRDYVLANLYPNHHDDEHLENHDRPTHVGEMGIENDGDTDLEGIS